MAHRNLKQLFPSNRGHLEFIEAISERVQNLQEAHIRIRGTSLFVPPSMEKDFRRLASLIGRYKHGDYRHSRADLQAARNIAQWSVDENCDLRNVPRKEIQWIDPS